MTKKLSNIAEMINLAEPSWNEALRDRLIDIAVSVQPDGTLRTGDHEFINMCSCSYLGLESDPRILQGAKDGIDRAGLLHLTTARVRIYINLLREFEDALSEHFDCQAMAFNSCSTASSAFLPLLASGHLTGGRKPLMAFDKFSHFSLKLMAPICREETEVEIIPHIDLNYLEDLCRKHENVCYIGDGTYSMGGLAPVADLLELQDKYGLFVFLDDSHGLSVTQDGGWGYARGSLADLSDRSVVVASLAKAFGTCGGVLMSSNAKLRALLERYGNAWSQYLNSAGIGAGLASLSIHASPDLGVLQAKLAANLEHFDRLIHPDNMGSSSPIRLIRLATAEDATGIAKKVFDAGFYTSPVFFPIVAKGTAGLRVMPRANLSENQIAKFCRTLLDVGVQDVREDQQ